MPIIAGMVESDADVGIIGAGPIGIELAVALRRARLSVLHFDAKQIGYTISWFPPQTQFFSSSDRIAIASVPLQTADQSKATREEYLAYLRGVVQQFDLQINTYEPVTGIRNDDDGFVLTTRPAGGERFYRVRKLVLATGGTDRPRLLNISGEDLPHVSHYFRDPHLYFRKRLLVVGGKNSAVETAIRCYRAGACVSMSYRRPKIDGHIKYWLMPEITALIEARKIESHMPTVVTEIGSDWADLRHGDGTIHRVEADFVLLLTGYEADMSLCRMAGVEVERSCQRPRFDDTTMETSVGGIYVAGTATGGTQEKYTVFIENCHVHTDRIVAALTGNISQAQPPTYARPES